MGLDELHHTDEYLVLDSVLSGSSSNLFRLLWFFRNVFQLLCYSEIVLAMYMLGMQSEGCKEIRSLTSCIWPLLISRPSTPPLLLVLQEGAVLLNGEAQVRPKVQSASTWAVVLRGDQEIASRVTRCRRSSQDEAVPAADMHRALIGRARK
jgi:hypothetical protein